MDIAKAIEVLSDKIGISVREMLPHFTGYYFWSSVCWALFGVILIAVAAFLFRVYWSFAKSGDRYQKEKGTPWLVWSGVIALIGLLWIAANIPGIINPTAEGYYHLLKAVGNLIHK